MYLSCIEPGATLCNPEFGCLVQFWGTQCKETWKNRGNSSRRSPGWSGQTFDLWKGVEESGFDQSREGKGRESHNSSPQREYKDDRSGQFYELLIFKFSHCISTFHCFFFLLATFSFFITGGSHYFKSIIPCTFMTIYPLLTSFNIIESHVTTAMQ